jgi:cyclic beta-1,2-glucan synthetase
MGSTGSAISEEGGVWLGWFLISALKRFAPLAEARGGAAGARGPSMRKAWNARSRARLRTETGTCAPSSTTARRSVPAGPECRIDSISTVVGRDLGSAPQRRAKGHGRRREYLVRRKTTRPLFTPPFDRAPVYPGYIKGYLPGVRENGGQYTHAAVWALIAFAMLGEGDKATERSR